VLSKVLDYLKIALRIVLVFLVFHINIFKNDIIANFSFYLLWVKNKTFMEKHFLENSKWWNNLI
jgi:predicted tellurium resistance membrane protein TerC